MSLNLAGVKLDGVASWGLWEQVKEASTFSQSYKTDA
jgi:hypothetical protein